MIIWPERFHPSRASVFVSNQIEISAPIGEVWACMIEAIRWPAWYPNSRNIRIDGGADRLGEKTRFRWTTFGLRLQSQVEEWQPPFRLAWSARCIGVDAYHAWEFRETNAGTHVLTEETQYGTLAVAGNFLMPRRMSRFHQIWLERLASRVKAGNATSPAGV